MRELDRLIRKAGGKLVGIGKHRYYDLDGHRLTIHNGSQIPGYTVAAVRRTVRRIVAQRQQGKS